ncbi:hypothetical protein [Nitratireductor basaltis]|uniref:Surface antigen domain-containing protein n=1 Tax=Nitratireductor basaltis TaxID=472175 RepID=A0A084UCF1_9HYPH|nr:hypothetical protein [Nitratireductor basaltis]KFB10637.1 hypothetical protein EL18_01675 [Nitratireductor basaltis]
MRTGLFAVIAILPLSGCVSALPSGGALPLVATQQQKPAKGIVGGALLINSLGVELSRREELAALEAEYKALETAPAGEPVAWRDERSGRSGTVTAAQPYRVGSQDCRPYSHLVEEGGRARSVRGTACRNPDGSWTLLI